MRKKTQILDETQLRRTIKRMAHEIIERSAEIDRVVLVGIRSRGEPIARMLAADILSVEGTPIPVGTVDITYYRDDWNKGSKDPMLNKTDMPFDVTGKTVVLVDDVLYTGRTVRAAMDAIMDIGRPQRIQLAVVIDRGHRELPIRADFVGRNIPTAQTEFVRVNVPEIDSDLNVWLYDR